MSARRATDADALTIAALWNKAVPIMQTTMPYAVAPEWTAQKVRNRLKKPHQQLYIEPPNKGFFLCQDSPIPTGLQEGSVASELNIWIVDPGLPDSQKLRVLRSLFVRWFSDHKGGLTWGEIPVDTIDKLSLDFCEQVGVAEYSWDAGVDYVKVKGLGNEAIRSRWRLYTFKVPMGFKG